MGLSLRVKGFGGFGFMCRMWVWASGCRVLRSGIRVSSDPKTLGVDVRERRGLDHGLLQAECSRWMQMGLARILDLAPAVVGRGS